MADENTGAAKTGPDAAAASSAGTTADTSANMNTDTSVPEEKSNRHYIVIGVVLLLVLIAGFFYWRSTFIVDTDDAQVDGNLDQISARIAGNITKVYIEDNQKVAAGQLLAEIDPTDYQVAVDQDEANLASAEANYEAAKVNVPITSINVGNSLRSAGADVQGTTAAISLAQQQSQAAAARVDEAAANAAKAQLDLDRYTPLVQKDVISKQQYDAAVAAAAAAKAALLEAKANQIGSEDAVRQANQRLAQSQAMLATARTAPQQVKVQQAKAAQAAAQVKQAQAMLEQARLNLSYTKITAPEAGIVNKKNVQIGSNVGIGQNLMTLIPQDDLWVTANFKETQLANMRVGQSVDIKVDALGGRIYHGKVTQVGGATGSRLSLFPPENATGNYVKVVQRIPVRIDFTNLTQENGEHLLRPGFSVTPEVHVK
ncbi:MAG: HlyD family secretion protein [Acidobacteriaceae bacterium]